ncbi:hypothetical protein ACIQXI_14600 [Lysinibacillus sp. NPDC097195]|uniref:hypothetical protein n=1 Tax=Lysinibacillus sp. NPDC097195 TaxID=3364141 RepID=UPI00381136CA
MRKKGIIIGMAIFVIATCSFVIKIWADNSFNNKGQQGSYATKEETSIATLKEKVNELYVGVDVKTTAKKELVFQVVADEERFNVVKRDIEPMAKSVMESSFLKDYKIVFERWELTSVNNKNRQIDKELSSFLKTIVEGLQAFEVFKSITTDHQTFITIQTSINGSEKEALQTALEMAEVVTGILQAKEQTKVPPKNIYDIKVVNAQGENLIE